MQRSIGLIAFVVLSFVVGGSVDNSGVDTLFGVISFILIVHLFVFVVSANNRYKVLLRSLNESQQPQVQPPVPAPVVAVAADTNNSVTINLSASTTEGRSRGTYVGDAQQPVNTQQPGGTQVESESSVEGIIAMMEQETSEFQKQELLAKELSSNPNLSVTLEQAKTMVATVSLDMVKRDTMKCLQPHMSHVDLWTLVDDTFTSQFQRELVKSELNAA